MLHRISGNLPDMTDKGNPAFARNRLAEATSPYLLQHRDNPVHWQPWEAAVFDEARRRNVPVLLSIGYAACHWCHVMAHESFEDDAVAESFVHTFETSMSAAVKGMGDRTDPDDWQQTFEGSFTVVSTPIFAARKLLSTLLQVLRNECAL